MTAKPERSSAGSEPRLPRMYSTEIGPLLQSLLATLADIDFAHQSDIETIQNSSAEEWLKQATIRKLRECHRERRAPYIQRLKDLQDRILAMAA